MSRILGRNLVLALVGIVAVPSVILSAQPAKPTGDGAHLETYAKPDGASYFALSLMPQAALPASPASDVVILFDTSASQMGAFREKGLQALDGLLQTLGDNDHVQLMAVDLNAIPLTKSFVAPRSPEMKAAVEKLRMRVPLGSTDMEAALKAVTDSYQNAPALPRAAVFIGDGRSNANAMGVDVVGLIDRLVKDRIAIHSFAVGPAQNSAVLAALANQTGGVVVLDGDKIMGPEAGQQLTHAIHEPIIWTTDRRLPAEMTEVYPAHTPPIRADRDTILIGKGAVSGDFPVEVKGEFAGKPIDLNWNVKATKPDDENAYLAQLVNFAKADGGYSLPTIGSEGLAESRRVLNLGAHTLAQLGRQAAASGNVEQAKQFANEAVRRDPNDPMALVLKSSLDDGASGSGKLQLVASETPASNNAAPPAPGDTSPREGDLLNSIEETQRLVSQRVMTETTVELNHLRDRMINDPAGTIDQLKLLLDRVMRVSELGSEQRADLRNRITTLLEQATQRRLQKEVADVEREQNLAAARERQRLLSNLDRKESELLGLVNRFNSLLEEGYQNFDQVTNQQMREARTTGDEIARVASNPFGREDVASVTARQFADFSTYIAENNAVRDAAARNFMDTMHLVDISHIPTPDAPPIIYPDVAFWRKISEGPGNRKEKYGSVDLASNSPSEQKILRALTDDKTTLEFVEIPLKDVIDYIKDRHHIEIVFDVNALKDAAIDPTALPVSINVHDLTLRSALKLILSQFNLTYVIQDEVLQITTKDKANQMLKTKVYPVADLVLPIQSQQANPFQMGGGFGGGGGGGGIGGGGGGFGGGGGGGGLGGLGGGGGGGLFGGGGFNVPDNTNVRVPPANSGGALAVGDDLTSTAKEPAESKSAAAAAVPTSVKLPAAAQTPNKPAASSTTEKAAVPVEQIVVKSDVDPEKFWNDYFAKLPKPEESKAAETAEKRNAAVRQVAKELMNDKKYSHVTALIRGALRNGYAQPWMYEALALAMQADNQPKEEIERALMSAVDFANTPTDVMNVAIYMARIGFDARALKLLRQAAAMEPFRHEPYMHGLRIAQRIGDADGIRWACLGVLSQAWPNDKKEVVDSARYAADALLEKLRKDGKTAQADDFRKALGAAQVRDCKVVIKWTGNGDIDAIVEEPTGAICSDRNPRTAGGGVMLGDTYAKFKTSDDSNAEYSDEYVLPQGFSGQYKLLLRRLWGQIATGKVTVDVYTHYGTPKQVHVQQQIPVSERDALVTFDLADGRRTEPLAQAQLATAAANQVAVNQAVLANQLSSIDTSSSGSNSTGIIGAPGTGGFAPNPFGLPFLRTGAVGYQPVITTLPEGANMVATAVISADRRYVRITATPFFSTVGPVDTFNFATGGGTTTPTTGTGTGT